MRCVPEVVKKSDFIDQMRWKFLPNKKLYVFYFLLNFPDFSEDVLIEEIFPNVFVYTEV